MAPFLQTIVISPADARQGVPLRTYPSADPGDEIGVLRNVLGRVDKRDSSGSRPMIQLHLYVGDELGTQPDIRR